MIPEAYKPSLFWLAAAGVLTAVLIGGDLGVVHSHKGRTVAMVQHALQWLLVEPLGDRGAAALVMGLGLLGALLAWPRGDRPHPTGD